MRSSEGPSQAYRRRTNAFILAFLGLQLVLPLRSYLLDKHDSRADFGWNMYSHLHHCERSYTRVRARGQELPLETGRLLRYGRRDYLDHRDRLPHLHAWLCEELRRDEREVIRADVRCRINDREVVALVDPTVDICSAEDYGVLP